MNAGMGVLNANQSQLDGSSQQPQNESLESIQSECISKHGDSQPSLMLSPSCRRVLEEKFPMAYQLLLSNNVIQPPLYFSSKPHNTKNVRSPQEEESCLGEPEFPAPIFSCTYGSCQKEIFSNSNEQDMAWSECATISGPNKPAKRNLRHSSSEHTIPTSNVSDSSQHDHSQDAAPDIAVRLSKVQQRLEKQLELLDISLRSDSSDATEMRRGLIMLRSPRVSASASTCPPASPPLPS